MAGAARRSAIPIVLVLGSEEFAERCRVIVEGQALVVAREPVDARHAATAWLPRAIVCTFAVYASDPAELEATVRRVRCRLVKVPDEDVSMQELGDQLRGALGASGVRGKA